MHNGYPINQWQRDGRGRGRGREVVRGRGGGGRLEEIGYRGVKFDEYMNVL